MPKLQTPLSSDSGSHKVQHYLNAISLKIKASLPTIDGTPANYTDLERAPGVCSIANGFSGVTSMVSELLRCEVRLFTLFTLHHLGPGVINGDLGLPAVTVLVDIFEAAPAAPRNELKAVDKLARRLV